MTRTAVFCVLTALVAVPAAAQNPMTAAFKVTHENVKGNITKAAEKMPEEHYGFKPSPEVRSFGQIVGHVANANFMICSAATGAENPNKGNDAEKKTTKAEIQKVLADSFAFCDKQYEGMTDAKGAEPIAQFFFPNQNRQSVLAFNTTHNMEHYGNLVTYMRIKGLVPPSSEQRR